MERVIMEKTEIIMMQNRMIENQNEKLIQLYNLLILQTVVAIFMAMLLSMTCIISYRRQPVRYMNYNDENGDDKWHVKYPTNVE